LCIGDITFGNRTICFTKPIGHKLR
jgi:hypothetical protein